jgi:formate/nitrite transporter FocA (FNT family)
LRLWALVLAANIAATWLFSFALAHTDIFEAEAKAAFREISHHTIASSFWTTMVKAVFAGWLIALMVWLLPAAEGARVFVILLVTWVVAVGEFAHIIAGSVDASYLVHLGEATFADYLTRFFLPTLLGNVIGGVTLVAVLNFGQVATDIEE